MSVLFVAEVSSNHNQDLDRCLELIDQAAEIGCAAVKFQLFKVQELFAPEILARSQKHQLREAWELPVEFLPKLADRCHQTGIQFSCTPFYLDAVEALLPYVEFYKIASYELLWDDLLTACAMTGKPVILSTGMATLEEVKRSVSVLRRAGCRELSLLHCVSGYPTPRDECNLAALETLRKAFACPVGWSDHSLDPDVIYRAVHRWAASLIEFHLDLDGTGVEYSMGHCWLPGQIAPVIESVKMSLQADGNGQKMPAPSEFSDRAWRTEIRDGLRPLLKIRQEWREQ